MKVAKCIHILHVTDKGPTSSGSEKGLAFLMALMVQVGMKEGKRSVRWTVKIESDFQDIIEFSIWKEAR